MSKKGASYSRPSVDSIAERAKRQLDVATAALGDARRQLSEAEDLYARAKSHFFEADLQRHCSWNKMYEKLVQYKEDHGDTLVLTCKGTPAEIKKLGKWVQNQRVHYKYFMNGDKKHIKEHRIEALNSLGFIWNVNEHFWDLNFAAIASYFSEHSTFDIPKKHSAKLNSFVTNLRKAMSRKEKGLLQKELTEERINRLNSINFHWNMKHPSRQRTVGENVQFEYLFNLLVDFKEHYGHVHVSKMMPIWRKGEEEPARAEYKRLPFFIAGVKTEHVLYLQGKPCALDQEKVMKLDALGIKWKRPASEPRRSGGVKRKKIDEPNITTEASEKADTQDELNDTANATEDARKEDEMNGTADATEDTKNEDEMNGTATTTTTEEDLVKVAIEATNVEMDDIKRNEEMV